MTLYYKMWQTLLQNATAILLQNASPFLLQYATVITKCNDFITKCDSYYKMRGSLQNAWVHTKCELIKENTNAYWYYLPSIWHRSRDRIQRRNDKNIRKKIEHNNTYESTHMNIQAIFSFSRCLCIQFRFVWYNLIIKHCFDFIP